MSDCQQMLPYDVDLFVNELSTQTNFNQYREFLKYNYSANSEGQKLDSPEKTFETKDHPTNICILKKSNQMKRETALCGESTTQRNPSMPNVSLITKCNPSKVTDHKTENKPGPRHCVKIQLPVPNDTHKDRHIVNVTHNEYIHDTSLTSKTYWPTVFNCLHFAAASTNLSQQYKLSKIIPHIQVCKCNFLTPMTNDTKSIHFQCPQSVLKCSLSLKSTQSDMVTQSVCYGRKTATTQTKQFIQRDHNVNHVTSITANMKRNQSYLKHVHWVTVPRELSAEKRIGKTSTKFKAKGK